MSAREEALARIVEIARAHDLDAGAIGAALNAEPEAKRRQSTHLLGRILGTLGGIFVFAGLGVFISMNWDAMNSFARVVITLGPGLSAFVLALYVSRDERGQRVSAPLYLIAAALQPVGILVGLDEFSSSRDWDMAALVTAGVMALQQGLAFRQRRDGVLLFTTILFSLWALGTALDMLEADGELIALFLGASTVSLCIGLARTPYRGITPFWYLAGSGAFLAGLFALLEGSPLELLFLVVACGGVYLSIIVRSRTLLFVSTVAILGYISYFSAQHFIDSLGWPVVLIALGLLLIGLSAAAMKINRRYITRSGQ